MIRTLFGVLLGLTLFTSAAAAAEIREIDLKDGSVITGEVVSMTNGIYTIKSDNLGIIKLEEAKIREIREVPPAGTNQPSGTASGTTGQIRILQEKMMNDQEIMGMIRSLQNDPDFKKALEDPSIRKAVQDGDVAALTANPAFMKLLNNATVKDIQKKVQ
jgi:hypothetical protein